MDCGNRAAKLKLTARRGCAFVPASCHAVGIRRRGPDALVFRRQLVTPRCEDGLRLATQRPSAKVGGRAMRGTTSCRRAMATGAVEGSTVIGSLERAASDPHGDTSRAIDRVLPDRIVILFSAARRRSVAAVTSWAQRDRSANNPEESCVPAHAGSSAPRALERQRTISPNATRSRRILGSADGHA